MPSTFDKFFDRILAALGLAPGRARAKEPQPPSPGGAGIFSLAGFPITAADCRGCGFHRAKPEYNDQFCSYECEQRMADSMDAWHDQFEERFGEGDSVDEWRAQIEEEHGKDYLADIEKRARKKD